MSCDAASGSSSSSSSSSAEVAKVLVELAANPADLIESDKRRARCCSLSGLPCLDIICFGVCSAGFFEINSNFCKVQLDSRESTGGTASAAIPISWCLFFSLQIDDSADRPGSFGIDRLLINKVDSNINWYVYYS